MVSVPLISTGKKVPEKLYVAAVIPLPNVFQYLVIKSVVASLLGSFESSTFKLKYPELKVPVVNSIVAGEYWVPSADDVLSPIGKVKLPVVEKYLRKAPPAV